MANFDPQHDYEDLAVVKARTGGPLREECRCRHCRMAGVGRGRGGRMLVPAMRKLPDGRKVYTARWLHGFELKRHLEQRQQALDQFRRVISGMSMAER
jgi:hypothetical protein